MTNQTQSTDPNDQNVVEFGDSPGRRLRVQRQSRGLAIERIASQLHLKPEIIEALEQDRFDLLPDPVFITGYLRNYARMLGLDPTPLIAAYQAHAGTPKSFEPTRPIPGSDRDSGGTRILVRLVSLALAAAVVAMIALWWHDRPELAPELGLDTTEPDPLVMDAEGSGESEGVDTPAAEITEQTPEAVTEATPADGLATPGEPEAPITERSEVDPDRPGTRLVSPASIPDSAPELSPEPSTEPTADPVAETTSGPLQTAATSDVDTTTPVPETTTATKGIVLEFTGPSWLEVRDAAGQRLIAGEMKAGDRQELTGQAPFRITVGRVNNSSMTVDGKPFDLEGRSRGNVARFSFDPASPE
ncbi:RodZ domain-containing protein [Thiocapsa roseopersicina]|uniref:Cytoskeleton protein RodZ n=1 Tax=Thiocapsa roseopersicina TaxID=1058 RepID=A0A1H2WP82_THIRO|nr:RodZ domain-containing protein [Thiocapsa roseopersicina]SDW82460.1 cytoskeleton protein RodZ [Thiocapsa roseopersicina]